MDERLNGWQHGVERLLAEADPDYGEALLIAEEIARCDEQPTLRQAATQGLPSFRNAALKGADSATKAVARRQLAGGAEAAKMSVAPPPADAAEAASVVRAAPAVRVEPAARAAPAPE